MQLDFLFLPNGLFESSTVPVNYGLIEIEINVIFNSRLSFEDYKYRFQNTNFKVLMQTL